MRLLSLIFLLLFIISGCAERQNEASPLFADNTIPAFQALDHTDLPDPSQKIRLIGKVMPFTPFPEGGKGAGVKYFDYEFVMADGNRLVVEKDSTEIAPILNQKIEAIGTVEFGNALRSNGLEMAQNFGVIRFEMEAWRKL